MSSKAKAKALADDFDDNEVASMLEFGTPTPDDAEQWNRDQNGDLDWTYTSRTVRKWSPDALLSHLWEKSFSIPPRDYNPSAPFVWVKLHSGDIVTLPHGYRLPLMFVAKYRWEVTLTKISNERLWKQERSNVFHLSRLCENLFRRAKTKALRGGMEKGWRCVMFDRLLARFYKHWSRNDPEGGRGFLKTHGGKEYDRDVLKHDWKRWCLRGLNGVRMTEDEVTNGITIDQFRKGLKKNDDGVWMLDDQPLVHITDEEPQAYSSSSDLTEFSIADDDNSSNSGGEGGGAPDNDVVMLNGTPAGTRPKRSRDLPIDNDEIEREAKRTRIENSLDTESGSTAEAPPRRKPPRIGNLSRTLAAMARNPAWANTTGFTSPPASQAVSGLSSATPVPVASSSGPSGETSTTDMPPPLESASTSLPQMIPENGAAAPSESQINPSATAVGTKIVQIRHISQAPEPDGSSRLDPIYIPTSSFFISDRADKYPWPPALGFHESRTHSEIRMFQECTAPDTWESDDGITWRAAGTLGWNDEKVWRAAARAATCEEALGLAQATAAAARPARAASMKSRQLTKAASRNPLAGRSLPRAAQKGKGKEKEKAQTVTLVAIRPREPAASASASASVSIRAARAPSPPRAASSASSHNSTPLREKVATTATYHSQQAKQRLARQGNAANVGNAKSNAGGSGNVPQGILNSKALELLVNLFDVKQLLANNAATNAGSSSNATAGTSSAAKKVSEREAAEKAALEDRFVEIDGRFVTMKEELVDIVGRLQTLEQLAEEQKGPGRLVALRQEEEEEEGEEEGEKRVESWEDFYMQDMDLGSPDEVELENVEIEVGKEVEAEGGEEEAADENETFEIPTVEDDDTEIVVQGEGDANSVEKEAEPEADLEVEGENGVEGDKDVTMDEAGAVVEPPQRTYGEISIQTDEPVEESHTPPPQSVSLPPAETEVLAVPQIQESPVDETTSEKPAQPEDTQTTPVEETQAVAQAQATPTPTPSGHNSPQIQLHAMDANHQEAPRNDSSEPDTDITMVNATISASASSSALMKEEPLPLDPRTRDMSSNLSLLVDSMVSAKMLAVMEGMVKTRVADKEGEAGKDKERPETVKEGSVASSSADVDRERDPPPPHPLLRDTLALTQSPDSYAVAQLLDEVRNMQKQSRLREQREKEELQAMRELHSAEVDALRRRLSYLETQHRHRESDASSSAVQPIASSSSTTLLHAHLGHAESSYIPHSQSHPSHAHAHVPPQTPVDGDGEMEMENRWRSRQQRYSTAQSQYQYTNGTGNGHGQSSASPVESEPPAPPPAKEPPVRIYTDRSLLFRTPAKEREVDEVPLPIKSQRKQHMVFPRAQYG